MWQFGILVGLAILDAAVGLYVLHRLALWLEARGHLFYLHKKPSTGGGNALMPFQELVQPSVKHVYRMKEEKRKGEQDPGEKEPEAPG